MISLPDGELTTIRVDPANAYSKPITPKESTSLLESEYETDIAKGRVPDLKNLCQDLFNALFAEGSSLAPSDFIPVLSRSLTLDKEATANFLSGSKRKYVMVDDPLVKIVLIKWKPGKVSSKHGHPGGGGVIKVLKGSLEEKRFDPQSPQRLTSPLNLSHRSDCPD